MANVGFGIEGTGEPKPSNPLVVPTLSGSTTVNLPYDDTKLNLSNVQSPSLWSYLTPWHEENGETFGNALYNFLTDPFTGRKLKYYETPEGQAELKAIYEYQQTPMGNFLQHLSSTGGGRVTIDSRGKYVTILGGSLPMVKTITKVDFTSVNAITKQAEIERTFADINKWVDTYGKWGEIDRASVEAEKLAGMIAREGDMLSDLGLPRAVIPEVVASQIKMPENIASLGMGVLDVIGNAIQATSKPSTQSNVVAGNNPLDSQSPFADDIPTPGQVVGNILDKPPAPTPYIAPSQPQTQTPSIAQPAIQLSTGVATAVGTQAPVGWVWDNGAWFNEQGTFVGMDTDFPYITPNTQPIETTTPVTTTTTTTTQQPLEIANPDAAAGFQVETPIQYHQEFVVYPQTIHRTKPQTKPRTQPEVITQPTTEPVTQPVVTPIQATLEQTSWLTNTQTKTHTGTQTQTDTDTQTQTHHQQRTNTENNADRFNNNDDGGGKGNEVPNIRVSLPSGDDLLLTPEQKRGAIAWKQGIMFKLWLPPYNETTMINTRQPIQGITYHSGYRAAYDSVRAIGGNVPEGLTYEMGIMDIEFTDNDKDNQPEIAFVLDRDKAFADDGDMRVRPPAFSMIPSRSVNRQHKKAKHNKRHGNPSVIMGW